MEDFREVINECNSSICLVTGFYTIAPSWPRMQGQGTLTFALLSRPIGDAHLLYTVYYAYMVSSRKSAGFLFPVLCCHTVKLPTP